MESQLEFPKSAILTPYNYFEWKPKIQFHLRIRGLFRITMETEVEPTSAIEKSRYFNRMDEAFGILCLSISPELLFYVESCSTPNEVWKILEGLFGKQDEIWQSFLFSRGHTEVYSTHENEERSVKFDEDISHALDELVTKFPSPLIDEYADKTSDQYFDDDESLFEEDPQTLLAMEPSKPMHAYMMHGSDPQTYTEANGHPEWEAAVDEEYNSLIENQTWDLVPLPANRKLVTVPMVPFYNESEHRFLRLDTDGSLRVYRVSPMPGQMNATNWSTDFGLDPSNKNCILPKACGPYGICDTGQCSCPGYGTPDQFNEIQNLDVTQGCYSNLEPSCSQTSEQQHYLRIEAADYYPNGFSEPKPNVSTVKFARLSSLQELNLAGSYFEGSIPAEYGSFGSNLRFLHLARNSITGPIPPELGRLQSLRHMEIGYNHYSGGIPRELGNMTALEYLDIADASLSGFLLAELANLKKLNSMFMFRNFLRGSIIPELSNITGLKSLDLSDNLLPGPIPESFPKLKKLNLLSLSAALLYLHEEWEETVVHKGVTASNVFLDADLSPRLGGFALAEFVAHGDNDHHATGGAVRGIFGYMSPEYVASGRATTVADVFSFGVVVLEVVSGRMAVDFRFPAVLLVDKIRQFDKKERLEYMLVYEYMPGGDLECLLYRQQNPVLPWERRLGVALDCAEGLAYLHLFPGGAIVHRDIKPTNILLNESGQAKLSDFGISKLIAPDFSHASTEIKGTTGYLDPEYFTHGKLTEASDGYSFGIVLLQLISGQKAVVNTPSGGAKSVVYSTHMFMRSGDPDVKKIG